MSHTYSLLVCMSVDYFKCVVFIHLPMDKRVANIASDDHKSTCVYGDKRDDQLMVMYDTAKENAPFRNYVQHWNTSYRVETDY